MTLTLEEQMDVFGAGSVNTVRFSTGLNFLAAT